MLHYHLHVALLEGLLDLEMEGLDIELAQRALLLDQDCFEVDGGVVA